MQTSLETLGQLERRLTMSVPVATIESEITQRLARLAKDAKLPGFRPGKVPMRMIAQQYGQKVRSDVISDAVQARFADALREQNLRIAGFPRIEPRTDAAPSDELQFSAVFEIYPDVRIGDLSVVAIEKPIAEVGDEDISNTIEMLRRQRTHYHHVDRAAIAGDRVVVDFTGRIDGVEFAGGQASNFGIVIGEGRMLPEFETAVTGMSAGETKTFSLTFPADYHGKEVAGKQAEFVLTAKGVEAPHVPDVDADFAKAFGIASGSVDDLRAEIASNLRLELKRKIDAKLKEQVFTALRDRADFALPKALVDAETESTMQRAANELRERGLKAEDMNLEPGMFRPAAEGRVKLGLVIAELVRTQGLQAKPDQVKALVQEAAQTYEQPDAVIRWHYEKPERLGEFEALAVEGNVVQWALSRAKVVDKPTPFAELMGTTQSQPAAS
ncbi:MAG TPA: trigger factor [Casimicrobiaceae bacterium]|nr:trigger factor [Casimicrobiaceae bacterium]